MTEFPVDRPITLVISVPSGDIEVVAVDGATTAVDVAPHDDRDASRQLAADTTVDLDGDTLRVTAPRNKGGILRRSGSLRIRVTVPVGSGAWIDTASADVTLRGPLATTDITGASADLDIAEVTGDARVKTASGDVVFGRVGGELDIECASGDIAITRPGSATRIATASGDVVLRETSGDLQIKSASGDIHIDAAGHGNVGITTASGDVQIGVPAGTGVWLDLQSLSGSTRNGLRMSDGDTAPPNGHQLGLQVRTLSGDIDLRKVG
ncbi:DUF4097 family beta strand repeat-containing protein [Plantactinospora sp. KBS50]|uniref:DUF4097 family beta strand repeat-containing protein n=1 Tax=Plantactinospora sp. KBS50 TaxID=2024580 RepID=UPI000BAB0AA8|nr:DUF4097 family beta strand repeat-containing protein [Plantactinospora sp. KBS50]ASW54084.1 hypothetical protein CIK06_07625 [Plantactinospora sp. KBS50]